MKETKRELANRLLKEIAEEDKAEEEAEKRKPKVAKLFVVTNCKDCPNSDTVSTKGFGYAYDRICKKAPTKVSNKLAGYIEWGSEDTQDYNFPKWCPLKSEK